MLTQYFQLKLEEDIYLCLSHSHNSHHSLAFFSHFSHLLLWRISSWELIQSVIDFVIDYLSKSHNIWTCDCTYTALPSTHRDTTTERVTEESFKANFFEWFSVSLRLRSTIELRVLTTIIYLIPYMSFYFKFWLFFIVIRSLYWNASFRDFRVCTTIKKTSRLVWWIKCV